MNTIWGKALQRFVLIIFISLMIWGFIVCIPHQYPYSFIIKSCSVIEQLCCAPFYWNNPLYWKDLFIINGLNTLFMCVLCIMSSATCPISIPMLEAILK